MSIEIKTHCAHCQTLIKDNKVFYSDLPFCCHGCESVYRILHDNQLCQYYEINQNAGIRKEEASHTRKYDYLDNAEVIQKIISYQNGSIAQVVFHIPQIHCNSCLWLLERLYKIDNRVHRVEVHFDKKDVFIQFNEQEMSLKELVILLASIGYEPYIDLNKDKKESTKSQRAQLLKLGLSGFCFANIMMLSLPDYLSKGLLLETTFHTIIPYLSLLLSFPVIFYTAWDFFIPSYKNLRRGVFTIDLPVSIAIIITFFRSVYEIITRAGTGYLDSMTGIVFFMLIGRWMQNRSYSSLQFDRTHKAYFPIAVEKIEENTTRVTPIDEITEKNVIKIYPNEIIPVDGILSKGEGCVNYSFVTGESHEIRIGKGEYIYAGGRQLGGAIEVLVMKSHNQSQLTTLWNHQAFRNKKMYRAQSYIDDLGKGFTWGVLLLSVLAGLFWFYQNEYIRMWNTVTTVLIVACPCALLLANSFTQGHYLRILSQYQFFVRDASVLNQIQHIQEIVFDKTGTLTQAESNYIHYEGMELSIEEKEEIADIISQSNHTLSKSLYRHLQIDVKTPISSVKEVLGQGLEAWIEDKYYKIGSSDFCGSVHTCYTSVHISVDSNYRGAFYFRNVYRHGVQSLTKKLSKDYSLSMISGDNENERNEIQKILPENAPVLFKQSPHDKLQFIENLKSSGKKVMMVGDGLNDAGAFQASDVAIALTDKNNFFNPASDIIMSSESLAGLSDILKFIRTSKRVIHIVFSYSILYNLIGLGYALRGELSPVIAAILMPLSSISIILLVQLLTEMYDTKYLKGNTWKY